MREIESQGKTGIQWTCTTQFHNLDYADDIIMSSIPETATYEDQPSGTGCRENWPPGQQRREEEKIKLKDVELEDIHSFVY